MKNKTLLLTSVGLGLTLGTAQAATTISMNFIENAINQTFTTPATNIGPLATSSANWNSSANWTTGTLLSGTKTNLVSDVDGTSTATSANLSWNAGGVFYNGAGTGNNQQDLFVGYLDDQDTGGGIGANFTVTGIPYAQYNVYVLSSGDSGNANGGTGTYPNGGFTVNGTAGTAYTALGYNGNVWQEATGGTVANGGSAGNYRKFTGLSGDLSVAGIVGTTNNPRGQINGFVIEQVPEPSSAILLGLGALALLRRRR